MRLLIPGTKATEVPAESAQRRPHGLEPLHRHDAVLKFYGLVDDARATGAGAANPIPALTEGEAQ
jgi:hypothetical protein